MKRALTFSSAEARGGSTSMASAVGWAPPPSAVAMWGGRAAAGLSLSPVMGEAASGSLLLA